MSNSSVPPPNVPSAGLAVSEEQLHALAEEAVRKVVQEWLLGQGTDERILGDAEDTYTCRALADGHSVRTHPRVAVVYSAESAGWRWAASQLRRESEAEGDAEFSTVQRALLERLERLCTMLVRGLPGEDAIAALSAPTDLDVLTATLQRAPYALQPIDPVTAAAYTRGRAAREELLRAEGGVVSAEVLAGELNISRQAVDKRRRNGKLLALRERGDWVYPIWQIAKGQTIEGLEEVLQDLTEREAGAWDAMLFFLETETEHEGETPLQALRHGRLEAALSAARAYGEQGAR